MIKVKTISNNSNKHKKTILKIVKSLPSFFSKESINQINKDLNTHKIFGAFEGQSLVGFITFRKSDYGALELSWLAISLLYQDKGIGYTLVKTTLNQMAEKKYKICYVKTLAETDNDIGYAKTRKFYKSLGFNTLEIISPYPGWGKENPCQILAVSLPII